MTTRQDLWAMDTRALGQALQSGHAIDREALADSEYRGVSLGLPKWIARLTWTTFMKTFHRDASAGDGGVLRGWNVRLEQNGLDGVPTPRMKRGERMTFGHYVVTELDGRSPIPVREGLQIDYSRGGNPRFDGINLGRDPLVAIDEGSVELLLGWTYLDLGFARVRTPSYFTLERLGALSHVVAPPRGVS